MEEEKRQGVKKPVMQYLVSEYNGANDINRDKELIESTRIADSSTNIIQREVDETIKKAKEDMRREAEGVKEVMEDFDPNEIESLIMRGTQYKVREEPEKEEKDGEER